MSLKVCATSASGALVSSKCVRGLRIQSIGVTTGVHGLPIWSIGVTTHVRSLPIWSIGVPTRVRGLPIWSIGVTTRVRGLPMKTEWPYNPASSSSSSSSASAPPPLVSSSTTLPGDLCGEDFTSSSAPPAHTQDGRDSVRGHHLPDPHHLVTDTPGMGLQPQGLNPQRGHLPPYMRPHSPEGLPAHHRPGGHCTCQCRHLPQDRTILHSILTGQGYKFGYGSGGSFGVSSSPFFQTLGHYHSSASAEQESTEDLLLDLEPLDTK